jgi:hypothetical protein
MTETQQTQGAGLPEWAGSGANLEESQMDARYLAAEKKWRGEASRFWERERELRNKIKRSIDLTDDDRSLVYATEREKIEAEFQSSADAFTNNWLTERRNAYIRVHENRTDGFRDALLRTQGMDERELDRTLNVALRSGQADLAQAVAETAYENRQFRIFDHWARENPQMAANLQTLHRIPGYDQLNQRIHLALRPPEVGGISELRPGAAEIEAARERERNSAANVKVREFFGPPHLRRQRRRSA